VVDNDKQPLGWGLFAVHFLNISSAASLDDIKRASRAKVLLIDHLHSKPDAQMAKHGFERFMENERLDDPDYAYMSDTEVVEGVAVNAEWDDETERVIWQEFSGIDLQDFLSGTTPYVCPRKKWKPGEKPLIDRFFDEHPQPVWLEDQLRSVLDAHVGVEPDEDKDSPWQDLDLE